MEPIFKTIPPCQFIGMRSTMSIAADSTFQLWRGFMPRRKEIQHLVGLSLFSIQVVEPSYFDEFDPHRKFEKWAAMEVSQVDEIPADMEALHLPGGLYAVFLHKGPASKGAETMEYIYGTWLPASGYRIDGRPHFGVMDGRYKGEDPETEEEIWVPIV